MRRRSDQLAAPVGNIRERAVVAHDAAVRSDERDAVDRAGETQPTGRRRAIAAAAICASDPNARNVAPASVDRIVGSPNVGVATPPDVHRVRLTLRRGDDEVVEALAASKAAGS